MAVYACFYINILKALKTRMCKIPVLTGQFHILLLQLTENQFEICVSYIEVHFVSSLAVLLITNTPFLCHLTLLPLF